MSNSNKPLIEIKNLVKKFGNFTALNGVSLNVFPGEVHALLGDNGAGKSTVIKVLAGVHPATSGSIIIDGREGKFTTPRQATDAGIGTVYQDLALNALTSVTRNFFLGREITTLECLCAIDMYHPYHSYNTSRISVLTNLVRICMTVS